MNFIGVPREAFELLKAENDRLRAQNDKLIDLVATMRREGFQLPSKAGAVRQPPPDPDTVALARAEGPVRKHFIATATDTFVQQGANRTDAEREARRLLDEATSQQPST